VDDTVEEIIGVFKQLTPENQAAFLEYIHETYVSGQCECDPIIQNISMEVVHDIQS
jgi:hypothetical protein